MLTGMDPLDDLLKPPPRVVILNVNVSRETCVKHVSVDVQSARGKI
jgi:hypothetical protein